MSTGREHEAPRGHVIAKIDGRIDREEDAPSEDEAPPDGQRGSFVPRGELGPGSDELPPPKPRTLRPPPGRAEDSGRYAVITGRAGRPS